MAIATPGPLPRRPAIDRLLSAMPALSAVVAGTIAGLTVSGMLLGQPRTPGAPIGMPPSAEPTAGPTRAPAPSLPPSPSPSPTMTPGATPTPPPAPSATPPPPATPAPATPVPSLVPTPPPPAGLPACRYDDLLTPHHDLASWRISLLDTIYSLPSGYAPGDLVDTSAAGLNGGYPIRGFVVADLAALVADARAFGSNLAVVSGYRSHAQQAATFQYWVNVAGYEAALRTSARAGHSEHQLGTTIDFTTAGGPAPWEYTDWAATREGGWMAANAWRYGFVMSYPRGSFAQTCYDYEPWHYRYVGRELAARIHASGITPREVLWDLQ